MDPELKSDNEFVMYNGERYTLGQDDYFLNDNSEMDTSTPLKTEIVKWNQTVNDHLLLAQRVKDLEKQVEEMGKLLEKVHFKVDCLCRK